MMTKIKKTPFPDLEKSVSRLVSFYIMLYDVKPNYYSQLKLGGIIWKPFGNKQSNQVS